MTDQKIEYLNLEKYGCFRYNLGFGWFGPLEQCKDGELMKATEILPLYLATELRMQTAMEKEKDSNMRLAASRQESGYWKEVYYQEQDFNKELLKWNRYWRFIAVIESICMAALTAHFTGVI